MPNAPTDPPRDCTFREITCKGCGEKHFAMEFVVPGTIADAWVSYPVGWMFYEADLEGEVMACSVSCARKVMSRMLGESVKRDMADAEKRKLGT